MLVSSVAAVVFEGSTCMMACGYGRQQQRHTCNGCQAGNYMQEDICGMQNQSRVCTGCQGTCPASDHRTLGRCSLGLS